MQEVRRKKIIDIIQDKGSVMVTDLATEFDKSEMTIHRDLDYLESKGLLKKKRGGAVANSFSETYTNRSTKNLGHKQHLAKKVYDLIENYDTIMIDGSTTALEVVKFLKQGKKITVFTNSILVLNELCNAKNVVLYSIGSYYSREMVHFVGADVEEKISNLNFSKCIFGTAGITLDLSLHEPYPQLASIKRKMMISSEKAIVVADSSKFGAIAVQKFATIKEVTYIVTDKEIPEQYKELLESHTKLIY